MFRRTLGYDLRLKPTGGAAPNWGPARREKYLLRTDVAWPLSIDRQVWPDLFRGPKDDAALMSWSTALVEPDDYSFPKSGGYPNLFDGFWLDLALMRHRAGAKALSAGTVIRADLLTQKPLREIEQWNSWVDCPQSTTPYDELWQSCGFDVVDFLEISGLSNCGYDEEREDWRARWESKLNEHGLLADLADAFAFRADTDIRVEEHSPFFVYEIFVLPVTAQLQ